MSKFTIKPALLLICLLPLGIWSQSPNDLKPITPDDYSKWYELLNNPGISNDGTWLGYTLYNGISDTTIIEQINGNKRYVFSKCQKLKFLGDSMITYEQDEKSFLMNLNNGHLEAFGSGTEFSLSNDDRYLMIFNRRTENLVVRCLLSGDSLTYRGVLKYFYNPAYEGICAITSDSIDVIELKNEFPTKYISLPENRKLLDFKWHSSGTFIAFTIKPIEATDAGLIGYYDLLKEKLWYLNPSETEVFPSGHMLISHWNYPLEFSPDGSSIFYAHGTTPSAPKTEVPQIWKSDDPFVRTSIMAWSQNIPRISMWHPAKKKNILVTDSQHPECYYGFSDKYSLIFNSTQYRLHNSTLADTIDVYVMNLENREKHLLVKKLINTSRNINTSPSGRYIMYLSNGNWWCYDTRKKQNLNLTERIEKHVGLGEQKRADLLVIEGWSADESEIFIQNMHDLWKVSLGDIPPKRLTFGKESGAFYKLINQPIINAHQLRNRIGAVIDDSMLIFEIRKGDKMGYAFKKGDSLLINLSMDTGFTRWPKISLRNQAISFTMENYQIPPKLYVYDFEMNCLQEIFQSNPHYKKFQWYRQEKLLYRNMHGKQLTGILKYPMGFNKDSVYPMIVHVYEKQTPYYQQYHLPSLNNPIGFNPTNLTAEGYFVFLPDIEYTIGKPGISAADCIISGTNAALDSAPVAPDKIGLMGQSFGGYQTLFTVTQTELFATAIAGASITDFTSDYFNIEGTIHRFFQYESSQLRMGRSLFEDYQGYLENSPIYFARNIGVPILLFTGGKDYHVHYTQTMAFHFAMKRLNKRCTMLIYPEEAHAFVNMENRMDLTTKVHQWFDHYLKGGEYKDWMP